MICPASVNKDLYNINKKDLNYEGITVWKTNNVNIKIIVYIISADSDTDNSLMMIKLVVVNNNKMIITTVI